MPRARNKNGWLTAKQLMSGLQEQRARHVGEGELVTVSLWYRGVSDQFVVTRTTDIGGPIVEGEEIRFSYLQLDEARKKFAEWARPLNR